MEAAANTNRIAGPYMALIGGKPTGLAGCSNSGSCARSAHCLRADAALQMRAPHQCDNTRSFLILRAA